MRAGRVRGRHRCNAAYRATYAAAGKLINGRRRDVSLPKRRAYTGQRAKTTPAVPVAALPPSRLEQQQKTWRGAAVKRVCVHNAPPFYPSSEVPIQGTNTAVVISYNRVYNTDPNTRTRERCDSVARRVG